MEIRVFRQQDFEEVVTLAGSAAILLRPWERIREMDIGAQAESMTSACFWWRK